MYCIQPQGSCNLYGYKDHTFITQTAVELWLKKRGWTAQKGSNVWELTGIMTISIVRLTADVPVKDADELPKGDILEIEDDLVGNFYQKNFQTV